MANNEQFDKDVQEIVKKVSDGLDNKDLSGAIGKIRQEMQENSPDDWKRMLDAANKGLDAARQKDFGSIDLIGVDGQNIVFENKNKVLVHLDSKATVVKSEAQAENRQQPTDGNAQQQAADGPREKKNSDGSTITFQKQADGREHPTKIVHSDGTTTDYTYDRSGNVNKVVEKNAQGQTVSEYKTSDGNAWSKVSGPNELPAQIFGKLSVGDDGTHVFRDAQFGITTTRTADGTLKIVDAQGKTLLENKVKPIEQPAQPAAQPDRPADRPREQPAPSSGDRVQQNADGSIIEFTRQGDGKAHPTKIVHPDGSTSKYTYDSNGNPNSVTEYKADGTKFSEYKATGDGTTWDKVSGDNLPPQIRGKLSVGDDGSHQFVDSITGNTFVRRADGSIKLTDRNGIPLHEKGPDAFTPKPAGPPQAYKPANEAYNPAGPPGIGEFSPGETFSSERTDTKGQYDIDWRKKTGEETSPDGSKTYRYEGELDDGIFTDTNFEGSETISKDGKLLKRHAKYHGGADLKFNTPEGVKAIDNVSEVDTAFDSRTGKYVTTIKTEEGKQYRAETSPDGAVTSFKEVTDAEQSSAPGDTKANIDSFKAVDGVFNPVRPMGIGELRPGQAEGDEGKGVDWRTSRAVRNEDGSTTYNYTGEIEDSWFLGIGGDTNYTAEETVDHNGQLTRSKVEYGSTKDLSFLGPRGQKVSISNVKNVETNRTGNNYETKVMDSDGKTYIFVTAADGTVLEYKEPQK